MRGVCEGPQSLHTLRVYGRCSFTNCRSSAAASRQDSEAYFRNGFQKPFLMAAALNVTLTESKQYMESLDSSLQTVQ